MALDDMNTSNFPDGSLGHLAHAAQRWLKAREIEKTFYANDDLEGLSIIAKSLDNAQEEFIRAARLVTQDGTTMAALYNLTK